MVRMVRSLLAMRLAVFAVVVGVLVQAALGLPVSLRMAATAATICTASHAVPRSDAPAPLVHDHAHCLLCQGGSGGPPLPATAAWLALPGAAAILATAPRLSAIALPATPRAFAPRAPPALV